MAGSKTIEQCQSGQRGLGTDLAMTVVGGAVGGVAGAAATHALNKVTGADKPKNEPKKS